MQIPNKVKANILTPKQEKFVQCIREGKTQYEAYITAYPISKNWKRNSIDCNASQLMNDTKILQRLRELGYKEEKKIEWTRRKALDTINKVIEYNAEDMERINNAYIRERQQYEAELVQLANVLTVTDKTDSNVNKDAIITRMKEVNDRIAQLDKQPRVNKTNISGILEASKILNRMFGFDITKVEINSEDEERENMKALSKEELKAIAYANINEGNTEES